MAYDLVSVFSIRQTVVNPTRDRCQRRQVPCRCVVPNWEERLEVRRWRCDVGLYNAITSQTPPELVVKSQVLPAEFQVVPSKRGREVIPNGLGVLQNVERAGADRIAAQHDNHGTPVQDRVIWKVPALPSDSRLVLPLVIRKPAF